MSLSLLGKAIEHHFSRKTAEIQAFTETGYSFEEWFNWELYFALKISDSKLSPKPRYKSHGLPKSAKIGDVFFSDGKKEFIVEVSLVHDYTQNKWLDKIRNDREQLRSLHELDDVVPVQLIVMASEHDDLMAQESWSSWLESLDFWSVPKDIDISLRFPKKGQVRIAGWEVAPDRP